MEGKQCIYEELRNIQTKKYHAHWHEK